MSTYLPFCNLEYWRLDTIIYKQKGEAYTIQ